MQATLPRLTVFRLLLAVAVAAILLHVATRNAFEREAARRERCLVIADHHARLGENYRQGGGQYGHFSAAWHDFMRRTFEEAAARPGAPIPKTPPLPPPGWRPDAEGRASVHR